MSSGLLSRRLFSTAISQPAAVRLSFELNDKHKSDRALVIAHGLFASKASWKSLAKRLNDQTKFKVYTVDMRNHGSSYPYTDEMDYVLMGNDLKRFISETVIGEGQAKSLTLMGHSMGGKAAMAFALSDAENAKLVDKLVVADIAPSISPSLGNISQYLKKMCSIDTSEMNGMKNIFEARKYVDAKLCELDLLKNDNDQRQFLLTRLVEIGTDEGPLAPVKNKFDWNFNIHSIRANVLNIMGFPQFSSVFAKSTMFIHGERSGYVTPKEVPYIEKLFSNFRLVEVPKAGHVIHFDNPTFTINAIDTFLNE